MAAFSPVCVLIAMVGSQVGSRPVADIAVPFMVATAMLQTSMSQLVFVFGTLKEGFPNFTTNKGARVAGDFMTVERYPLYLVGERWSPWLVDAAGEGEQVVGQVFEVDEATLAAMDVLERIAEHDGYRRVMLEVQAPKDARGATFSVHAYIKPREQFAPIAGIHPRTRGAIPQSGGQAGGAKCLLRGNFNSRLKPTSNLIVNRRVCTRPGVRS